jgi:Protein of unknown function (DUF3485)
MRLDTPPLRRLGRRIGRPAPLVTLAILLASPAVLARQSVTAEDLERQAAIATEMAQVPFQIKAWVGSEVPIPTDQTEILHPNALLSREYTEIGARGPGTRVTLLLVHCSDVRDMDGHWPLHCYPKSGWKLAEYEPSIPVFGPDGFPHDFARARFTLADGGTSQRTMTVFFAFVLPDGRIETDMRRVASRTTRKSDSLQGVAQFQFVFSGDVPADRCAVVAKELMVGVPRSLRERLGMPMSATGPVRSDVGEPSTMNPTHPKTSPDTSDQKEHGDA